MTGTIRSNLGIDRVTALVTRGAKDSPDVYCWRISVLVHYVGGWHDSTVLRAGEVRAEILPDAVPLAVDVVNTYLKQHEGLFWYRCPDIADWYLSRVHNSASTALVQPITDATPQAPRRAWWWPKRKERT